MILACKTRTANEQPYMCQRFCIQVRLAQPFQRLTIGMVRFPCLAGLAQRLLEDLQKHGGGTGPIHSLNSPYKARPGQEGIMTLIRRRENVSQAY